MGGAIGWGQFTSAGTDDNPWAALNGRGTVSGDVYYLNVGIGLSAKGKAKWPIDAAFVGTWYQPIDRVADNYKDRELQMLRDLRNGDNTPLNFVNYTGPLGVLRSMGVKVGASTFSKNGWITPDEYQKVIQW
ncbi:MAG: hypothetical protein JW953_13335 [Anaerolineae bacterium]|nr:hypothetical protein [Anaerolineae bacterium]